MLPNIDSLDLAAKKILVRLDLDVPVEEGKVADANRLQMANATIEKVLSKNISQLILLGHRGRPEEKNEEDSNKHILEFFKEKYGEVELLADFDQTVNSKIVLFENLRFWKGESENSDEFAAKLSSLGEVYINESFATAHRAHASVVGIPKYLPHAVGERFAQEVQKLTQIKESPARPLVSILSGVKEDKKDYIESFAGFSDKVLVGGRLPVYLGDEHSNPKVVLARLIQDKEDITVHSMEIFEEEIKKAKSIIVSGPLGKYEEEGHRQGTKRVFEAVANADSYKLAGGGDTEAALSLMGLTEKFDWISTGGGAMLEFLAKGTLPAIEALKN